MVGRFITVRKSRAARGFAGVNRGSRKNKKPHVDADGDDGHTNAINGTSASVTSNTVAGSAYGGSSVRPITSSTTAATAATISAAATATARGICDNEYGSC